MGFYDFRCAVSGISLRGADAVLVVLEPDGDQYRPVTLGVTGCYDRLGSIDNIKEDLNTALVTTYFRDRATAGDFVLNAQYAHDYGNPPRDIESLLGYFERNVSDSSERYPAATLFGRRLFSALVALPVWTALASAFAPDSRNPERWFKEVFRGSPAAEEMYQGHVPELTSHIGELFAVNSFLEARALAWSLPDGMQHYGAEMRQYLNEAQSAFHDVPAVLAALAQYAEEVDDLLHDE